MHLDLMLQRAVLVVSTGLLAPVQAGGQATADSSFRALHIPRSARLTCRLDSSQAGPSLSLTTRTYEFRLGEELREQRVILATYDTAGRPLLLRDHASMNSADGSIEEHLVMAAKDSVGQFTGWRFVANGRAGSAPARGGEPSVAVERGRRELQASERQRAEALLLWLHAHRCARPAY